MIVLSLSEYLHTPYHGVIFTQHCLHTSSKNICKLNPKCLHNHEKKCNDYNFNSCSFDKVLIFKGTLGSTNVFIMHNVPPFFESSGNDFIIWATLINVHCSNMHIIVILNNMQ